MGETPTHAFPAGSTESVMPLACRIRCMTLRYPLCFITLLTFGLCAGLVHAQVQPQNPLDGKNVLALHAFEANVPIFESTDHGLRAALDSGRGEHQKSVL